MAKTKEILEFVDLKGLLVSEVYPISSKIEIESVLHNRREPEQLRIYLDANNKHPNGSKRPQVVLNISPSGEVESVAYYSNGQTIMYWDNK
jgi:hypothetical protein